MKTLGAYMILKNEQDCIADCLNSILPICDEIVIVDTGCEDNTMDIVRSFNSDKIKIQTFTWVNHFATARNFAMSFSTTDYHFTTDADEVFNDKLIETILDYKQNDFYNADAIEMQILNCSENGNSMYLGGRTIVKRINDPMPIWRYRIHEKLYYNENNTVYITDDDKYIIHKKKTNNAKSNYNKYAELYFDDLNNANLNTEDKLAHYYYYLFFTLYNIDKTIALNSLVNCYNTNIIKADSEQQRIHLFTDGYITREEFETFLLINSGNLKDNDVYYFLKTLKEDDSKYYLLKYACENTPFKHHADDIYPEYGLMCYNRGLIKDFIETTNKHFSVSPQSQIAIHNMSFINNIINPFKNRYALVLDCSSTNALPSIMYYTSQFFDEVYFLNADNIESRYSIPFKRFKYIKNNDTYIENEIYVKCDSFIKREYINKIMFDLINNPPKENVIINLNENSTLLNS